MIQMIIQFCFDLLLFWNYALILVFIRKWCDGAKCLFEVSG